MLEEIVSATHRCIYHLVENGSVLSKTTIKQQCINENESIQKKNVFFLFGGMNNLESARS